MTEVELDILTGENRVGCYNSPTYLLMYCQDRVNNLINWTDYQSRHFTRRREKFKPRDRHWSNGGRVRHGAGILHDGAAYLG